MEKLFEIYIATADRPHPPGTVLITPGSLMYAAE
jgi:hypothetical protein